MLNYFLTLVTQQTRLYPKTWPEYTKILRATQYVCQDNIFVTIIYVPVHSQYSRVFTIFLIYIFESVVSAKGLLFADDLKLMYVSSQGDALKLHSDLDNISLCSKKNRMNFNVAKCNIMQQKRD